MIHVFIFVVICYSWVKMIFHYEESTVLILLAVIKCFIIRLFIFHGFSIKQNNQISHSEYLSDFFFTYNIKKIKFYLFLCMDVSRTFMHIKEYNFFLFINTDFFSNIFFYHFLLLGVKLLFSKKRILQNDFLFKSFLVTKFLKTIKY